MSLRGLENSIRRQKREAPHETKAFHVLPSFAGSTWDALGAKGGTVH